MGVGGWGGGGLNYKLHTTYYVNDFFVRKKSLTGTPYWKIWTQVHFQIFGVLAPFRSLKNPKMDQILNLKKKESARPKVHEVWKTLKILPVDGLILGLFLP